MQNDEQPGVQPPEEERRFADRGFRILGLSKADIIRYFFGGNASFAIFILLLICIFLFKEAAGFLPDHHHELGLWRKTGQEFVDLSKDTVDRHTMLGSLLSIAYQAELNSTSKEEQDRFNGYQAVLQRTRSAIRSPAGRLKKDAKELTYAQEDIAVAQQDLADPGLTPEKKAELEADIAELQADIERLTPRIPMLEGRIAEGVKEALEDEETWDGQPLDKEDRMAVREAVEAEFAGAEEAHPWVAALEATIAERKAAQTEKLAPLNESITAFRASVKPLKGIKDELVKVASALKNEAIAFESAPRRKAALLEGAENTDDPEEKARKIAAAEAVVIVEPAFDEVAEQYYGRVGEIEEAVAQLRSGMETASAALPAIDSLEDGSARTSYKRFQKGYPDYLESLDGSLTETKEWRHDKPYSWPGSIAAFFVGKDWVTNSSWHDFYGFLPLFLGSLLISVIALVVSVPFALAAAIYVNQLATPREQGIIKPAIEFIQAIPSVVLGFFGIMILGEGLRELSQIEWLSWVPGFPMQERLNILNAGLLLAFMAVPTIFTLCEDALNNVPKTYTAGALALGATRMQTILRIVVPTALSGIIAAVLLGFGRIIGETMVVLLVAGGKIQIPDFTKGLGVVTEAAHTMTGIIAQETGEVDQGSIHWRALFMIGLVLFFISLGVNWTAQGILRRFQRHT